ncbi:hypothetical protein FQN49_007510 [Arthroderma sp. PD_2]|nr:hypothetical protein FQN49_007510 [Arthroderma sp. PD_2]
MTPKPQRTTRGISGGDAENPPSQPSNTAPTGENRGTTPQTGETEAAVEEGKDIHDSNGADGHRDKRQRRNRDASSRLGSGPTSELGPETEDRVYLELRTERAAPWVGPPMHNPELYERIQRDAEAGVYIGPGAGIVVRYTPQSQTALAAGGTPAPEGGRRAGDTAETAISVAGTSSDIDELPAIRKKRSREEERSGSGGDCHSKSDKGQGQERKEGTVGGNSSDSVTDDARERRYPRAEREGTVRRVGPALGE